MNLFNLFDNFTLAIIAPAAIFFLFMLTSAMAKGCVPWPSTVRFFPTLKSFKKRNHFLELMTSNCPALVPSVIRQSFQETFPFQAALYLTGAFLGTYIFGWASTHILWSELVRATDPPLVAAMFPLMSNLAVTLIVTLPILYVIQAYLFVQMEGWTVQKTLFNGRFIVSIGMVIAFMMIALPTIQYAFACFSFGDASLRLSKELFRISFALAVVPLALTGLPIAFFEFDGLRSFISDVDYLQSDTFYGDFIDRPEVELHRLIDLALRIGLREPADAMSKHLLERASAGHILYGPERVSMPDLNTD